MQNVIYNDYTWEEERNYEREIDSNYFNARTKEPDCLLLGEILKLLTSIEYNIPEMYERHIKFALKYADMCNEDNLWGSIREKKKPLVAKYFFNHNLYYLCWFMNDERQKECMEVLLDCINKGCLEEINKWDKSTGEQEKKNIIGLCTRFGEFGLAKQELDKYSDIKEIKIEPDIIYDFYGFYFMLLDYFTNKDMDKKEQISDIFLHFFSEHEKINRTLWGKHGGTFEIYHVYYIYYRYFLGLPEEEITAYNVLRSGENGICFWRK